jgi:hypothetical protein
MIPCLNRDVVFSVGSKSFQRLAIRQDINMIICNVCRLIAFKKREAGNKRTSCNEQVAKQLDMLESCVDIFEL